MKRLKKWLLAILGEKRYLALVAGSFQSIYRNINLGVDYQDLYFLKNLVRSGDYCVDIGAHLGYYALELSRLAGEQGKVLAIEPIRKFHDTLQALIQKKHIRNIELFHLAMGGDGEFVEMGIPRVNDEKKFAYARVMKSNPTLDYVEQERVRNASGDDLFANLPRLDFIKCDVEGLEMPVFLSMMQTITKHRPIILCELADKQERIRLTELLGPLGYKTYILEQGKLLMLELQSDRKAVSHNHYFIPATPYDRLRPLISESLG